MIFSGNAAWGGLSAPQGNYYLGLQAANCQISQIIATAPYSLYKVTFSAALQPGSPASSLCVTTNATGTVLSSQQSLAQTAQFSAQVYTFQATSLSTLLQFSNCGSGTQTVFVDNIAVTAVPTQNSLANGGFETATTSTSYVYTTPSQWVGSGCNVVIYSGNSAWGGLAAPQGKYYLGLQGAGCQVYQTVWTAPGLNYVLSFQATYRPGTPASTLCVYPTEGGAMNAAETFVLSSSFATYSYTLTGTGGSTALVFSNCGGAGDQTVFVDNIQLCYELLC